MSGDYVGSHYTDDRGRKRWPVENDNAEDDQAYVTITARGGIGAFGVNNPCKDRGEARSLAVALLMACDWLDDNE